MPLIIPLDRISALIFDLDGVITDTAKQHAEAWKHMFDEYLRIRSDRDGTMFRPFEDSDYRNYLDGKPRYDGVKDFLASRQISLPFGENNDLDNTETVCGLGNRKNSYYLKIVKEQGATLYQSSVNLIHALRRAGIKTAIISSSRNCTFILQSVGIQNLFDAKVDGVDLETLNISGKPDPSMFLEAAKRLGVTPDKAAIVEDSLAGVEAGRKGGFALVIGVNRVGNAGALVEHGAHSVVSDLGEIELGESNKTMVQNFPDALPSALDLSQRNLIASRRIAVFLDYDGTLTEIVEDPEKAFLSEETRQVLRDLSPLCTVAILSGRDLEDVRKLVNVGGIVYSGCHGFELMTAEGERRDNPDWIHYLPIIDEAEKKFRSTIEEIDGTLVERKRLAISVHYRKVNPSLIGEVKKRFDSVASSFPQLRTTEGKKVFEVLPNVDWNKGKALLSLMRSLGLDRSGVQAIFIGDDLTDEEGFRVLQDRGIGIIVGKPIRETLARYCLSDPTEVRMFLETVIVALKGGAK